MWTAAPPIDEFTGADRLLRLRWPCPVPGAMPVSEVGDAVIGRGFALTARARLSGVRRLRTTSLDAGQPGLRLVRAVLGGAGPRRRCGREEHEQPGRAGSVGGRGGFADRDGVGAAGAGADGRAGPRRRHRHLQQRRQAALRRPRRRLQPARCPDRARRPGPELLHRSGFGRRRPRLHRRAQAAAVRQRARRRVWVPAAAPLAERCGCPARTCAACAHCRCSSSPAGDGLDAAVAVGRRRPRRRRDRRRPRGAVGARAVRGADRRGAQPRRAELRRRHRRHPAHVADAVLHRLAVRGVDRPQPRRTAPDGSNFQLQHWTHTFDYALVSGDGDWRRAEIPARSAEFSHPLLAVAGNAQCRRRIAELGLAAGDRARGHGRTRRAEGGGQPAGVRQQPAGRPAEAVAIRLVETRRGRPPTSRSRSGLHRVSVGVARQPARGAAAAEAPRIRGRRAARLRDRHDADPAQHAAGARGRPRPARARGRGGAAAVCAVLAAQPRPRAARRAARRRASAPAGHVVAEPDDASRAAAYRSQRLHRRGAARHGAAGVPRRLDGRARRAAVRAAAPASIWRPTSS